MSLPYPFVMRVSFRIGENTVGAVPFLYLERMEAVGHHCLLTSHETLLYLRQVAAKGGQVTLTRRRIATTQPVLHSASSASIYLAKE